MASLMPGRAARCCVTHQPRARTRVGRILCMGMGDGSREERGESTSGRMDSAGTPEPFSLHAMKALRKALSREKALQAYQEELQKPDPDVLKCAVHIAQGEYPDLHAGWVTTELDRIASLVECQLPPEDQRYPLRVLQCINNILYKQLGYEGNEEAYYEPENSYINRVMQRRKGIPITLSLVYMEVAKRVGMPMVAVNLPGHFCCKPAKADLEVLIDAFHGGEICMIDDVQALLSGLMGVTVKLDPAWMTKTTPLPARTFLMRMLNNLKQVYRSSHGEHERLLRTIRYMRATDPSVATEVRDEGYCLYAMERYPEAAAQLAQYLKMAPKADDVAQVQDILTSIAFLQSASIEQSDGKNDAQSP